MFVGTIDLECNLCLTPQKGNHKWVTSQIKVKNKKIGVIFQYSV